MNWENITPKVIGSIDEIILKRGMEWENFTPEAKRSINKGLEAHDKPSTKYIIITFYVLVFKSLTASLSTDPSLTLAMSTPAVDMFSLSVAVRHRRQSSRGRILLTKSVLLGDSEGRELGRGLSYIRILQRTLQQREYKEY